MLIAAACAEGYQGIGIDRSILWLVVARRLIRDWGGQPQLAAGLGEALPLSDRSVSSVISLDVIEHVQEPARYLREIDRVTITGGRVALSTPNRYSLTAEPHAFVWGVGWLPPTLQRKYVKWRTGRSYNSTRLLGSRELSGLLRHNTRFVFEILIPPVSEVEIARYALHRRLLARLYNSLAGHSLTHWVFLKIGPFFRIVGKKT
jgi:SAM-dependent methyltransferase